MSGKVAIIAGILSTKRYAAVAAAGAAGTGAAYYLLTMSMLASHLGAAAALAPAHLAASLGLTAAVSALAGVNFALIAYRIGAARAAAGGRGRRAGSAPSATTVLGGAAAAFTPGCPACTAPLAVVLGAVGGLSVLPMQGLELKALSAGALLFSVYWVARGIERRSGGSCCSAAPAAGAERGAKAGAGASEVQGGRGAGGCGCGLGGGSGGGAAQAGQAGG